MLSNAVPKMASLYKGVLGAASGVGVYTSIYFASQSSDNACKVMLVGSISLLRRCAGANVLSNAVPKVASLYKGVLGAASGVGIYTGTYFASQSFDLAH